MAFLLGIKKLPMLNETVPTAINELTQEIVLLHTATISRLLKCKDKNLRTSALALYIFYAWVCAWQNEKQVKANDSFCIKGLGWGKDRFYKAKAALVKTGLIEQLQRKNSQGKIIGSYIYVKFVKTTVLGNHSPEKPDGGFQDTSAIDKNISALNITSTNVEDGVTKKRSSCPLLIAPLKERYPRGHVECAEYVTSFTFVNKPKQFKFLHQMLRSGLDFSDIDQLIRRTKKKPFFQENGWDFASLAGEADRSSNAQK